MTEVALIISIMFNILGFSLGFAYFSVNRQDRSQSRGEGLVMEILKSKIETVLVQMPTKEELHLLESRLASKEDIRGTQDYILRVEAKVDQLISKVGS